MQRVLKWESTMPDKIIRSKYINNTVISLQQNIHVHNKEKENNNQQEQWCQQREKLQLLQNQEPQPCTRFGSTRQAAFCMPIPTISHYCTHCATHLKSLIQWNPNYFQNDPTGTPSKLSRISSHTATRKRLASASEIQNKACAWNDCFLKRFGNHWLKIMDGNSTQFTRHYSGGFWILGSSTSAPRKWFDVSRISNHCHQNPASPSLIWRYSSRAAKQVTRRGDQTPSEKRPNKISIYREEEFSDEINLLCVARLSGGNLGHGHSLFFRSTFAEDHNHMHSKFWVRDIGHGHHLFFPIYHNGSYMWECA